MDINADTTLFMRITLTVREASNLLDDLDRMPYSDMNPATQTLYNTLTELSGRG